MNHFKSIFREYDIRGRVNDKEFNHKSVIKISQAFAAFLKKRGVDDVVLGYDNRIDSHEFAKTAIDTLISCGINVHFIGLTLSPAAYFAQYHLNVRGVMMITASHNPNGWAGVKLGADFSRTFNNDDIAELYMLTKEEPIQSGEGQCFEIDIRSAYIQNIVDRVSINKNNAPKLVIDAANGGAGLFAYELFQKLGCMVFQLNCDPDTAYPHYFPNPSDLSALLRLREMVTHPYIMADMGLSFDGDGDRLGVMDSRGESIWSDLVLMLLAADLLKKEKGAQIVFDVKCSQALIDTIVNLGGKPIMCKTGHSHIKSKMLELRAPLAGERSGHIFYGGDVYFGFDDALFAGAKLVELVSQSGENIEQLLKKYPRYYTSPEIKAACADNKKYDVVEQITQELKDEYKDAVIDINGARVQFDNGWGLVRASTNLPELVMVFEGVSETATESIYNTFKNLLAKYNDVSAHWENLPENWIQS